MKFSLNADWNIKPLYRTLKSSPNKQNKSPKTKKPTNQTNLQKNPQNQNQILNGKNRISNKTYTNKTKTRKPAWTLTIVGESNTGH